LCCSIDVIPERLPPRQISIPANDAIGGATLKGLFRIKRGVNASEHNERPALFRQTTYGVSAQGIPCVNADAYDVARADCGHIQRLNGLVTQNGVAELGRSGCGQDEEPSRRDYRSAKSGITWIDYMDSQTTASARAAAVNANTSRGLMM
jgi:hypothetical protein